jgi:hypothetical protein
MATTFTLLASNIVSTAVSSITFNSIGSTYTDLKLVFSARETSNSGSAWQSANLTFNSNTSNYSSIVAYGSGGGTGSAAGGTSNIPFNYSTTNLATAGTFGNTEIYIPNYTSANYKSVSVDTITENNAAATFMGIEAGLWSNTAAITSITLTASASTFAQYSSFYLYGIKKS